MGKTVSSSKRSSSKKKKSKASSQTRRKKTSRSSKSKRLHQRKDSPSFSDESSRSLSISSFDSEEDYRSRKGRSRVREKVKSNKKRARRSSSSRESSVDSPPVKKRKGSKRDSKIRKKSKKPRRKASVSSSSSDSEILRGRRHDTSSGEEESEYERMRGRSRKKKNDKSLDNAKIRSKKSKLRSRSSSRSRYSDCNDNQSKDETVSEIFPRRLKSVVTVVNLHHEEEVIKNNDEHKEEIFYYQDDYPSCRSNDSNDGGKREIAENLVGEESFVSKHASNESKLHSGDGIDQFVEIKPQSDGASIKGPRNENEIIPTTFAGSNSNDLETVLRQKALENLMRFRGPHKNEEMPSNHENDRVSNVNMSTMTGTGKAHTMNRNNGRTMRKDSSRSVQTEEINLDGRKSGVESRTETKGVVHSSLGADISSNLKDEYHTNAAHPLGNNTKSNTTSMAQQSVGNSLALEQVLPSDVSPNATSIAATDFIDKSPETCQNVAVSSSNNHNAGVTDACGATPEASIAKPITEDNSAKQSQSESKGNSQFEQKTMSVMRGGEMVQVSYKVYIPNRAPALARRKLQR